VRILVAGMWMLACVTCAGCGVAIASGPAFVGMGGAQAQTRLQFDTTRVRSDGLVAGTTLTASHRDAQPIHIDNVRARLGYGWQPRGLHLVARTAYEMGLGQPGGHHFQGTGMLIGAYADVGLRLTQGGHDKNRYYLARADWDLFVALHGGMWSPPRGNGAQESFEWGLLFGVRFEVGSDLLGHTRDR